MTVLAEPTLRERLRVERPVPLTGDVRARRERLAAFLRCNEARVHAAEGEARRRIRALLGWDDAALAAFVDADVVAHTSPHASMNAFQPMFAFPWAAAMLAASGERGVHLRTVVTHNNLSDRRWRPHAWWHRGADGSVVKSLLFSQGRRTKHHVLLSRPAPSVEPATEMDRAAVDLARHATNYAYFCLVYRAFVERHAGLHGSTPIVEVPVDLLHEFCLRDDGLERWARAVGRAGLTFRVVGADGRLAPVAAPDGPRVVCPNLATIAQVESLGVSAIVGAERMAAYLPSSSALVAGIAEAVGLATQRPEFVGFTDFPIERVLEHDPATTARLEDDGLRGSLPIGAADIGPRVAANLDRLLDTGYACYFST